MNKKKTVHIISHTHWDREWYLPYEKHHYLLIEVMDQLLDTLETDPNFKSFHLDGQTIILDDYLQVRPEKADQIKKLIEAGRLEVGPWYVLQDEFLTSSEANVRNLQYGMRDAKKWGGLSKIGYFPDSFGNIGQAPQILQQADIKAAAFGRGVKPTGFNNAVIDASAYESPYSEMKWQSPDGTEVTGILFANWYCNGNEIPVDEEKAMRYWDEHLKNLETFASTTHLLMLNGCDHQPIQMNLSEAIALANRLYPDYTFVHSSFNDYIDAITKETKEQDLKVVEGELRSQHTDGWGTLVNTASSRVYLKQMNEKTQTLLEKVAEPLAAFRYLIDQTYDHDLFAYAWKTLMQNHPHDSICGCSVDEVHDEMVTRFKKSEHFTEMLIDRTLEEIIKHIHTDVFDDEEVYPFVVFNTLGDPRTDTVTVTLDLKRAYYRDGVNKASLRKLSVDGFVVTDEHKNVYPVQIEDQGLVFDYDLPDDRFRQPYMARRVTLTFNAQALPALGYQVFALVKGDCPATSLVNKACQMENDYLTVEIAQNGSLNITDKRTAKKYRGLNVYEDTGDIGNEYMYKQSSDGLVRTTENEVAQIELVEDSPISATYKITHEWLLPESAQETLEQEQKELVWFTNRQSERSLKEKPLKIETFVTLSHQATYVDVKTTLNNNIKDHRLRALFNTAMKTEHHYAESVFEAAKRQNTPNSEWTNPDYSQHQQGYVDVSSVQQGLCIANKGLNEYEILSSQETTIAVTLLRAVGELGDWGHFPTPKAQCLGEQTVEYRIIPHSGEAERFDAYQLAHAFQTPVITKALPVQGGTYPATHRFIGVDKTKALSYSNVKVAEASGDVMLRYVNLDHQQHRLNLNADEKWTYYQSDVIEREHQPLISNDVKVNGHEVFTVGIKSSEVSK
ncbi:glycosyl hydrolase [Halolactibacillus alkaliphilus]|uniref:Glycosyl hydrolase n=1 Tax=Halolactibacillus alkaliphilus TaxID=442899 RepID=A0A511WWT4_9BACI|nr:alpha-mannosidase [Halolactibacillus alkaliphilus]GEN55580.1 glycosyl hydrolase [Halolactibacillus alkaliphilus]GGN63913.1 glycosyl hydrolase [Halolactibacillus alkaliphilus]SFO62204.1 alpha-mannosidase [Halolactibacillus alkaliphilus]